MKRVPDHHDSREALIIRLPVEPDNWIGPPDWVAAQVNGGSHPPVCGSVSPGTEHCGLPSVCDRETGHDGLHYGDSTWGERWDDEGHTDLADYASWLLAESPAKVQDAPWLADELPDDDDVDTTWVCPDTGVPCCALARGADEADIETYGCPYDERCMSIWDGIRAEVLRRGGR